MKKLLLVDDNQTLADVYAEGLFREGFEVITAYSGSECLDVLKNTRPDIILLDIMMPGMDGWETLQIIRGIPEKCRIPVLMVTAKALLADDLAAYGDLIDGFLLKPFSLVELAGHIRTFEIKRGELAACIQMAADNGADAGPDPDTVREFAELARQVAVQKDLTNQIVAYYEAAFADGGEMPDVVRHLQITFQDKVERLVELATLLGISEELCMQQILGSSAK